MSSPYTDLGVNPNATPGEIKRAYHKKAKELHPDKKTGNDEEMKKVNRAYAILKDATMRDYYDKYGEEKKTNENTAKSMGIAAGIVQAIIDQTPGDVKFFIDSLRAQWEREHGMNVQAQNNIIAKLEKFKKRIIQSPQGNDFISSIVDEQIRQATINIKNIEEDWECRKMAFTLLDGYRFTTMADGGPSIMIRFNTSTTI
jgi:curved DNA-binding protein CbpA